MPTASTSQISREIMNVLSYSQVVFYTRNTLAGDFPIVNKHLVNDLIRIKEWNGDLKDLIIADNGSVRNLKNLPSVIRNIYKTQWKSNRYGF